MALLFSLPTPTLPWRGGLPSLLPAPLSFYMRRLPPACDGVGTCRKCKVLVNIRCWKRRVAAQHLLRLLRGQHTLAHKRTKQAVLALSGVAFCMENVWGRWRSSKHLSALCTWARAFYLSSIIGGGACIFSARSDAVALSALWFRLPAVLKRPAAWYQLALTTCW